MGGFRYAKYLLLVVFVVDPSRTPASPECIRCGDCVKACRFSAFDSGFLPGKKAAPIEQVRV